MALGQGSHSRQDPLHRAAHGYDAANYRVEGDWSNASYFLAAGAVGRRPVLIKGLAADSLQGDRAIMDILSQMEPPSK